MLRPRWQHLLLAIFVLAAAAHQARSSVELLRGLVDASPRARAPFTVEHVDTGRPVVASVQPEAEAAGLERGDVLKAIDDVPFTGAAVPARRLAHALPGEHLRLTRSDGSVARVELQAGPRPEPTWREWGYTLAVLIGIPWLCLILGGWAVAIRPADPLAWLLLMLLLSFAQIPALPVSHWGNPMRLFGQFFQSGFRWGWAIWMMLFGLCFPTRLSWESRHRWVAWLLLGPAAAFALLATVRETLMLESFELAAPLGRVLRSTALPARLLQMAAIGVFFAMLGIKTGVTQAPDARRRLLLLHLGATVGLTPAFVAAILGLVRGRSPMDAIPEWLVIPILGMMMLFPLTLAYVIVVHRALDVRVVIRQGVRYAFARGGVMALRILISTGVILFAAGLASRPSMRRVDIVTVMAAGIGLVFAIGLIGEKLIRWTDRRFFRDALDAETILHQLGEKVRTIIDVPALLETVARALSDSLRVPRVALLVAEGAEYRTAHALGFETSPEARFAGASATIRRLAADRAPARVYLDEPVSWAAEGRLPAAERAALERLDSQLLVPLLAGDSMPCVISLGPRRADAPYAGSDLKLLQSLAVQIGMAFENCRLTAAVADEVARRERLHREVEIAREVQERLFPQRLPPVEGLDYAGACRPALGVGGDYYDFLALPGGRLGLAIADVSGKGIGAALLMASLQASLRGQTLQHGGAIARLLESVNQQVHDASPDNRYATFFYGQYDPPSRRLTYVNAGHCPPLVLRPGKGGLEILRLPASGTVVGLFPDATYAERSVTLERGDLLVAYTDGISEAMNHDDDEWGEERLIAAARGCDGQAAREIIGSLMRGADAFAAGAPQHDDMTLVVARVV